MSEAGGATIEIPLFPLHTVLCPGVVIPVHVFESRYRLMVGRLLQDGGSFGVVLIRAGREVGDVDLAIAEVGTVAEIQEARRYADGRFDLSAIGRRRFRLIDVVHDREPYLVGRAELLDEVVGNEDRARLFASAAMRRFIRYLELAQPADGESAGDLLARLEDQRPREARSAPEVVVRPSRDSDDVAADLRVPDEPTALSHLLAGIVELDLPHRQALLEADTTELRLAAVAALLEREISFLGSRLRIYTPDLRLSSLRRN